MRKIEFYYLKILVRLGSTVHQSFGLSLEQHEARITTDNFITREGMVITKDGTRKKK